MSKRAQENLVAFIVLGIFVAAIIACMSYGPRARLVPVTISSIGALMIIAQILIQNLRPDTLSQVDLLQLLSDRGVAQSPVDGASAPVVATAEEEAAEKQAARKRELIAFGFLPILAALFFLFGPAFAIFFFMAGYFIISGQYPPAKGIAFGILYAAIIYLGFAYVLDVQFGPGLIDLSFGLT